MADRYIDEAYVVATLGTGFVNAVKALGISVDVIIEAGTSVIQSKLRNSGYGVPAAQEPGLVEELVKSATLMATWIAVTQIPGCSIKLPDNYKENPHYVAYAGLVSGDAPPAATPDQGGAVGGMKFASATTTTGSSSQTSQRTSRDNLAGY